MYHSELVHEGPPRVLHEAHELLHVLVVVVELVADAWGRGIVGSWDYGVVVRVRLSYFVLFCFFSPCVLIVFCLGFGT